MLLGSWVVPVNSQDVELVPLSRSRWPMRVGIAAAALFLLAAVAKPWAGQGGVPTASPSSPGLSAARSGQASPGSSPVAVARGSPPGATASPSPATQKSSSLSVLCLNSDDWRIVVDDVELGQTVRTWLVADAEYSAGPPTGSTIPVDVVSTGLEHLGLCPPPEAGGSRDGTWVATVWRQGAGPIQPLAWQLTARLDPRPGSAGALAEPVGKSAIAWLPGLYFIEVDFSDSTRKAWLGLVIDSAPTTP